MARGASAKRELRGGPEEETPEKFLGTKPFTSSETLYLRVCCQNGGVSE